jgi:hypothetical protein
MKNHFKVELAISMILIDIIAKSQTSFTAPPFMYNGNNIYDAKGEYLDYKAIANGAFVAPVLILEKMDIENSKPIAETQAHYQDLINELTPQT